MLSRPRRLPLFVSPVEGESFASYVDRLASELAVPASVLLSAAGVFDLERKRASIRGYGLTLPPEHLRSFAHATWLEPERVHEMLLAIYAGVAFDARTTQSCREGARRVPASEWVYLSGSHACPGCLGESSAWRAAWKLPSSFACVRHRCLLVDRCQACGGHMGGGQSVGRSTPYFFARVPQPGRCANPPAGTARGGRSLQPCGQHLAELSTVDVGTFPALLSAQAVFDLALAGSPPQLARQRLTSLEFFGMARSLCALILFAAEPEDLGQIPEEAVAAFERQVAERQAKESLRRVVAETGRDARAGPRTRWFRRVPREAALMAAITPLVVRIVSATSKPALGEAIAPLVERAQLRNPKHARHLAVDFAFTPELRAAYEANLTAESSLLRLGT